ncbi:MAG: hypothetical protein CMI34_05320 [Opitutales bacterium]|nr:hypothetical protein [Opitutales bacterium]|tara:strand:+ start:13766 stop:14017 length:252 start_codon:yes stop_codon:yes gene_type:complete
MIQKTIKTIWNNLAPVHGKYVDKAKQKKTDLKIVYQGKHMIIGNSKLNKPVRTTRVPDKFTGQDVELYYFQWDPVDPRQQSLL